MIVAETDGYAFHRARFEADRASDQRLAAQGYLVRARHLAAARAVSR